MDLPGINGMIAGMPIGVRLGPNRRQADHLPGAIGPREGLACPVQRGFIAPSTESNFG